MAAILDNLRINPLRKLGTSQMTQFILVHSSTQQSETNRNIDKTLNDTEVYKPGEHLYHFSGLQINQLQAI